MPVDKLARLERENQALRKALTDLLKPDATVAGGVVELVFPNHAHAWRALRQARDAAELWCN